MEYGEKSKLKYRRLRLNERLHSEMNEENRRIIFEQIKAINIKLGDYPAKDMVV